MEIPKSPVEVEFKSLPLYSETIRVNTLSQLEEETERLKELIRVDLARQSVRSEQWTCTGVGDIPIAQCVTDGARVDNGLSSQPVPDRKEAWPPVSINDYLSRYYDESFRGIQTTRSVGRYIEYPVYSRNDYLASYYGGSFICGRCGEDVRYVSHCIPKQLTDGGPKRLRFPDDTVVDSLPDRREITDGSRPEPASQEEFRPYRLASSAQLPY